VAPLVHELTQIQASTPNRLSNSSSSFFTLGPVVIQPLLKDSSTEEITSSSMYGGENVIFIFFYPFNPNLQI
jgi:hypothetical protein